MCSYSMIADHYRDKFWSDGTTPTVQPWPTYFPPSGPTQQEFDELKKELENMKELLHRAKIYDAENGEPDCETDEKMALLRKLAAAVGIDLEAEFQPRSQEWGG